MLKGEIRQQLVDHYLDFYTLAYSILEDDDDARDTVQEALARTMAKSHVDDAMNYCYQTVRRVSIDILRYRKRIVPLNVDLACEDNDEETNGSYAALLKSVMQLRNKLPSAIRSLVILHDEQGMGYAELSKLTGMSSMTIRRRLKEAHVMMRYKLKEMKGDNK